MKGDAVQPYYQQDGITIYHGDCQDVLPTLGTFDIAIIDPPYGMEFQSNYRQTKHPKIHGDESLPVDNIVKVIRAATAAAYVFCRWDNLSEMPPPKSVLAWVKNNWSMGDLAHEHGRQWEACCFYAKDNHSFTKRIPDVIYADRTGNGLHPTEKPVHLIRQLICANVGETILDAYCGSGTTLLAAKLEGRQAVGIELEERYCEIAANRLRQGVLQFEGAM